MRFSLVIISATILSNMVNAAPVGQSNIGIDATQFKGEQISKLVMTETFGTFHWKTEKNGSRVDRVFTLELSEAAEFQITDFMMGGDVFEVIDNGKSIGKTSELEEVNEGDSIYAATPEEALQDDRFSKAAYPLDAGTHEITIKVAGSLSENGTGAVRVVQKLQSFYNKKGIDKSNDDDKHHGDKNNIIEDYKDGKNTVYVYYTVTDSADELFATNVAKDTNTTTVSFTQTDFTLATTQLAGIALLQFVA